MINFASPLTNEDIYADADHYTEIGKWYWALGLIVGNFAGIPLAIITFKTGFYFLSSVVIVSMLVSCYYHTCQTLDECFGYILFQWVQSDHVTATALMCFMGFFFFFSRSTKQIIKAREQYLIRSPNGLKTYIRGGSSTLTVKLGRIKSENTLITYDKEDIDENKQELLVVVDDEETEKREIMLHNIEFREENMIYDAFSAFSAVFLFVFIVLQVIAHPFSYHAFINVLTLTLLIGLFKFAVIDECAPKNLKGRLSYPELIIGIILASIGLTCYVIDSYTDYEKLHTLWHVFIYLAGFFVFIGLIRNTPYFYSMWTFIYDGTFRCFRCCTPSVNYHY